jgi:hypothetical protein
MATVRCRWAGGREGGIVTPSGQSNVDTAYLPFPGAAPADTPTSPTAAGRFRGSLSGQ